MLVLDGEEGGAEVYMAATPAGQARICWTEARNMIKQINRNLRKEGTAYQQFGDGIHPVEDGTFEPG